MSKTLPAPRTRAPMTASGCSVPARSEEPPSPAAPPALTGRNCVGAPRRAVPRRRISSNLGEPAGMFVWERDFLLALAADVLEDFVKDEDEEDEG